MHGDQRAIATPVHTGYMPGLDGLRALSVIAVLLYHARMPWLPGGFLGVEVFFVISGYLITLLLTQEFGRSTTISLRRFWTRRARRLLAAVYTLLAVVSTAVLLFYREDADQLAGQVWAALTYVTNWFLIVSEQSYFALIERPPVFQHLWSLAIEEQFYLLWPILLLAMLRLFRGRPGPIAGIAALGAVASLVWMALLFEPAMDPSRAYYGTDSRASGLLLGAALAMVWKPNHRFAGDPGVKTVSLDLVGMAAVAVVIGCFATMRETDTFLYRGGFAVVSVASCVAIMATVHTGTVLGQHVLAHPVLTWIGVRSYSLYLWHWPIFVYTRPEIDQPLTLYPTLVLRLALTVIAAELSYRYVEVPIRNGAFARWRRRLARRQGARRRTGPIVLASAAGLLLARREQRRRHRSDERGAADQRGRRRCSAAGRRRTGGRPGRHRSAGRGDAGPGDHDAPAGPDGDRARRLRAARREERPRRGADGGRPRRRLPRPPGDDAAPGHRPPGGRRHAGRRDGDHRTRPQHALGAGPCQLRRDGPRSSIARPTSWSPPSSGSAPSGSCG